MARLRDQRRSTQTDKNVHTRKILQCKTVFFLTGLHSNLLIANEAVPDGTNSKTKFASELTVDEFHLLKTAYNLKSKIEFDAIFKSKR